MPISYKHFQKKKVFLSRLSEEITECADYKENGRISQWYHSLLIAAILIDHDLQ